MNTLKKFAGGCLMLFVVLCLLENLASAQIPATPEGDQTNRQWRRSTTMGFATR